MSYASPAEMIAAFQAVAWDIHAGTFGQRGEIARGAMALNTSLAQRYALGKISAETTDRRFA